MDDSYEEFEETPITLENYLNQVKYKLRRKKTKWDIMFASSPTIVGIANQSFSIRLNNNEINGVRWNIR